MVQQLTAAIPGIYGKGQAEWKKWHVFFCDERIVGFEDKESTYGEYKRNLIVKVPELESQFVVIDPSKDGKTATYEQSNYLMDTEERIFTKSVEFGLPDVCFFQLKIMLFITITN